MICKLIYNESLAFHPETEEEAHGQITELPIKTHDALRESPSSNVQ